MVPRPGFCFKKNHEDKTTTLTIKVTIPMDNPEFIEISVASVGWYLGGTIGIGTLMFAFGIGPCIALSLYIIDRIMN